MTGIAAAGRVAMGVSTLPLVVLLASCSTWADSPAASRQPSRPSTSAAQPSQTSADARRDGVPAVIAALPLRQRMDIVSSLTTAEGVWVASMLPAQTQQTPQLGIGTGVIYPAMYGELLLLDQTREHIVRAFPLYQLPPQRLSATADAVYCERQGDGALSDGMLCRVDRHRYAWTVRVFPYEHATDVGPPPKQPSTAVRWIVNEPVGNVFTTIKATASSVVVTGSDGQAQADPLTLELRPSSTSWCSTQDLRPRPIGAPSGLAGAMGYSLQVRNVSSRTCRVQGFAVRAQALTTDMRWRDFRFSRGTPLDGDSVDAAYLVPPGRVAVIDLVASHADGYRRTVWRGVRLMLPHRRGWITWSGRIKPDSGVGLGPIRNSD